MSLDLKLYHQMLKEAQDSVMEYCAINNNTFNLKLVTTGNNTDFDIRVNYEFSINKKKTKGDFSLTMDEYKKGRRGVDQGGEGKSFPMTLNVAILDKISEIINEKIRIMIATEFPSGILTRDYNPLRTN